MSLRARFSPRLRWFGIVAAIAAASLAYGQETFTALVARMKAAKPAVIRKQMDLLGERYDLSNRPAAG
ncbi:MAG: hypothetical protein ACRD2R_02425, partial [Terriglobales bacterium]